MFTRPDRHRCCHACEHFLHGRTTAVSPAAAYQEGFQLTLQGCIHGRPVTARASLWSRDAESNSFCPLAGTTQADVLVVGAGMTGLLTAARLADSGLDVLVVDAGPSAGAIR